MTDITWIIELALMIIMFILTKKVFKTGDLKRIETIVSSVVSAANELDITGELIKMGMTKADYALEQAKKLLEKNKITFNEDELLVFIKSAVTKFRIESSGTNAQKTEKVV